MCVSVKFIGRQEIREHKRTATTLDTSFVHNSFGISIKCLFDMASMVKYQLFVVGFCWLRVNINSFPSTSCIPRNAMCACCYQLIFVFFIDEFVSSLACTIVETNTIAFPCDWGGLDQTHCHNVTQEIDFVRSISTYS